ncbi:MAG: hypothetical protein R6U40_06570 [Desulfobacterales bacterium]
MKLLKQKFVVLMAFLATCPVSGYAHDVQNKVELGQGYRRDHLKWSISAPHKRPNIRSELDWKDIDIYLTTLKMSMSNKEYIAAIDLAYGDILNGRVRDSDYYDNRMAEYSRSYHKIGGDYTFDAMARIGRIFEIADKLTITPSLGYAAFWQRLRMNKGGHGELQSKGLLYKKLNSTYKARWHAPFVHLGFSTSLTPRTFLDAGYALFYPVRYRAKWHWNLRNMRNTDKSNGWKNIGHRANIGLRFACTERLELGFVWVLSHFKTDGGTTVYRNRNKKFKDDRRMKKIPFRKSERTFADYVLTLSYSF